MKLSSFIMRAERALDCYVFFSCLYIFYITGLVNFRNAPIFIELRISSVQISVFLMAQQSSNTVITFGTFDLLHVGDVKILERAKSLCGKNGKLIVGVSTDAFNVEKKDRIPHVNQEERKYVVKALGCVDQVFDEESMELKRKYIQEYDADILVMGDDWNTEKRNFNEFKDIVEVVYLKRTEGISTTKRIETIKKS